MYCMFIEPTSGHSSGLEEVIRQISLNTQPLGIKSRVLTLSKHPILALFKERKSMCTATSSISKLHRVIFIKRITRV